MGSTPSGPGLHDGLPIKVDIGNREVVGHGITGDEVYIDDLHYPFPAIRFKEENAEIAPIRQKEKGDWTKLTLEEKKALYRFSYCQTLSEMRAPTGDWKYVWGVTLMLVSMGLWGFIWLKAFIYPPMPESISKEENVKWAIRKMIIMRVNPIEGFTKDYDYDKMEFKKK